MSQEEIFKSVQAVLADCLAVDRSEIKMESRLIDDLGADSLDFLDILFRVEKAFSITLRDTEINRLLRGEGITITSQGERLTAEEVAKLAEWLPAVRSSPKKSQIERREVFSFITVEALALLVEKKLGAKTVGK